MSGVTILVGNVATVEASFADGASGAAVDPGTVRLRVRAPDGQVTTYLYGTDPELVREGEGQYRADWPIAQNGVYRYRFESENPTAAAEASFIARASRVV